MKGDRGGRSWRIGIDRPEDNNMIAGQELQAIISLKDRSLATSGNYRKFYVENGIKYSHTIDPKTGYPAKNQLLSATILANDCATADGVATACMVTVSYTHLRAHETPEHLVCRLLLEKKKQ